MRNHIISTNFESSQIFNCGDKIETENTKSENYIEKRRHVLESVIKGKNSDDAFYVADLGDIRRKFKLWKSLLPRVEPFYAVKCNPEKEILQVLEEIGVGFDCASKCEIQQVLDIGAGAERIVYANPCKQITHLRHAAIAGVSMMTFDNKEELQKIKAHHPSSKLVLRILTDDSRSLCKLSLKFGASLQSVKGLLTEAKRLNLDVIGVSFHVGSGCFDPEAFPEALKLARRAFDIGAELGWTFDLLDIGGGFPGAADSVELFQQIADLLKPAIDELFPSNVRVIAEPGRFFVASAFTLAVNIVARRSIVPEDPLELESVDDLHAKINQPDSTNFMYYVNEGMYGSFNCIMFDHAVVEAKVLSSKNSDSAEFRCSIWGPTCDSIDCIVPKTLLPKLDIGDWLMFEDMGAYTLCAASQL